MKRLIATFLFAAAAAFATPTIPVSLVNVGQPPIWDGTDFVGPYTLQLHGRKIPVLCTDFLDTTKPHEKWFAVISNLGINIAKSYFPGKLDEYEEEAYLLTMIVRPHADRIDIQHAAWAIMDPGYRANRAAQYWITQAQHNYRKMNPAEFIIISSPGGRPGHREQEFLAETAEPPYELAMAGLLLTLFSALKAKQDPGSGQR